MPINPKLKTYLEGIKTMDDAYRTKLIGVLEDAPPEVQNAWMSQDEYTRNTNAFKAEQKDWKTKADDFYTKSETAVEGWKAELKKQTDVAAAAQARVAELEASGGGGGSGTGANEALTKEIQGLQTLIKTIESKVGTTITREDLVKEMNTAYGNAVGFIGEQTIKLRAIERRHEKTFGTEFGEKETEDLLTFANERATALKRTITLDEAYVMKYGDEMQKKHDAQVGEAAINNWKSTHQIPTDNGPGGSGAGGGPEKGPLQIRLDQLRDIDSGKTDAGYKDWQSAARAGADELVKEGKY